MARSFFILLCLYSICVHSAPAPSSSIAGPAPSSSVAGPALSSSVAGPAPSSSVAGPAPSSSVAGPAPSSSVAGPAPSSSIAGPAPSNSVAGPAPSSTVASPAPSVTTETGDDTCDADPVWTTSSGTSSPPITTTAPAKPSCSLQNEDPDQGINTQGCICGSKTLPLLTVASPTDDSQSCAYTAWPSSTVSNPIKVESSVWTSSCQACTLVGGIADTPSCTSVSGCQPPSTATATATATGTPVLSINLSNTTVQIGDEDGRSSGADLRTNMYKKLQALCPSGGNTCDALQVATIDGIESLTIADQPDQGRLNFAINGSSYNSQTERDQMLVAATTTWEQAVSRSCKSVPYRSQPDPGDVEGCPSGPVSKRRRGSTDSILEDRSPIREDPCEL